jgi:hypothetical protein
VHKYSGSKEYASTTHSVGRNIPAQHIQWVRIFQCKYSRTQYSVSKDIPVQKHLHKVSIHHPQAFRRLDDAGLAVPACRKEERV